MQGAQEKYAEARAAWQARLAALAAQLTEYGESAANSVRLTESVRTLRRRSEQYAAKFRESTEGETELQKIKAAVQELNERLKEAEKAAEDERNEAAERKLSLEAVQAERYALLARGCRPQDILDELTRKVETANSRVNEACSASAAAEKAAADCRKRQEELTADCQSLHAELAAAVRKAQAELKNRLSAAECAQAQTEAGETGRDAELNERMRTLSQVLDVFLSADEGECSWSGCQKSVEALVGACGRRCGRLEQRLSDEASKAEQRRRLQKELEEADKAIKRLSVLNDMIGSAKGDRFVKIVQQLTLDNLLIKSNAHLQKFSSGRYLMKRSEGEGREDEDLNITIVDAQLGGVERAVANMSGGERFLISLSLALGLSSLSLGDATIDSLFLDEGFGTLDEDTLNTALDCLARLRSEDKLIGIISHVKQLRENKQLPLVIKVVKQGDGHSIITADSPGCRRLPSLEPRLRSRKSSCRK